MKRALLTLALLTMVTLIQPLFAAEEPICAPGCIKTPKPLTCEQLQSRMVSRHCLPAQTPATPCPTSVPCPPVVAAAATKCPDCPAGAAPVVVEKYKVIEKQAPAAGAWMVGAGPVWLNNWGAQAVAGYRFASGWQLQAGPMWVPQHATTGTVVGCPPRGGGGPGSDGYHCPCVVTPFNVPSKQAWGGSALVSYVFK